MEEFVRIYDYPTLSTDAFTWWENGSTKVGAAPPSRAPDHELVPFVVRVGNKGLIPINVLVFADSPEEAGCRVVHALRACCENDYTGPDGIIRHRTSGLTGTEYDESGRKLAPELHMPNRCHSHLKKLLSGEFQMQIAPYDKQQITKVQWASNGGCS